jgi:tetratricopeptide (TPR) repeat protein
MKSAYDAMYERSTSVLLAAVLLCAGVVARAQDPSPEPAATFRGITLYQQGDMKRAIKALEEAVRVDPTDADAWHYLGLALRHEGKSVEASEAFGEAVKWRFQRFAWVRPSDSRKGDLSVHLDERFTEAVQSLEEYLRLKPEAEPVWRGRLEAARFYACFYNKQEGKKRVAYSPNEVQTPVQILNKLEPALRPKRLGKSGYGVESVVLLVTYAADGTIKHIITVQAASPEYTQAVIDAARRIRFRLATMKGRPVSVVGYIY